MNRTATQSIGEIAACSMEAARVFEERGIDYCCGGRRALGDVCREKGIHVEEVLKEVEQAEQDRAGSRTDWTAAPLRDLIDHILSAHHAYLRRELPLIEQRMNKVRSAHGESVEPLAAVFADLRSELESHMRKEEMVLFPLIARAERAAELGLPWMPLPFGTFGNPIEMMEQEHDSAGRALASMRRLTGGYTPPQSACPTYRVLLASLAELERDLHTHIHLENNILFPRAMALEPTAA